LGEVGRELRGLLVFVKAVATPISGSDRGCFDLPKDWKLLQLVDADREKKILDLLGLGAPGAGAGLRPRARLCRRPMRSPRAADAAHRSRAHDTECPAVSFL